jgi:glucuronokinase
MITSTINSVAYARAGLLGNPSDAYNGKTISLLIKNFWAEVNLTPSERITLIPGSADNPSYESVEDLAEHVKCEGYYGGLRLMKAAIKRLHEFCQQTDQKLNRNFAISYCSNIPRGVGLAGSSAIVIATLRALIRWHGIDIPLHLFPSLALSVESDLGIPAGLQDRVVQAYGGVVFMDFSATAMKTELGLSHGTYTRLDPRTLPRLYVAYTTKSAQPTEIVHQDLRARFQRGDSDVVDAMQHLAALAEAGRNCLMQGRGTELAQLMDQNFDLRQRICRLHPDHVRMVESARQVGASAKFCGSGGAIIGTFEDEAMYQQLENEMARIQCRLFQPTIAVGAQEIINKS